MVNFLMTLFLVALFNLSSVGQKLKTDLSNIALISFDTSEYWIFKNAKAITLNDEDLEQIEHQLEKCVADYNFRQEKDFEERSRMYPEYKLNKKEYVIDLKRYKRQYVAVVNAKGEKEVWINCFCKNVGNRWKSKIVSVDDGGNCFFNLKVNITTKKYYEFSVNGDA